MSCDQFEKYEMGQIKENEFRNHLKTCPICRRQFELDKRLMSLAKFIKKPITAPFLWSRIEKSLEEKQTKRRVTWINLIRWKPSLSIPIAALILLMISIGFYYLLWPRSAGSGLLTEQALAKVEKKENEYIEAIAEMEEMVLPKMASLGLEMTLLYRDKLETIEEQIERCKEAIAENPENEHIRRYMLAALQDKKQALTEMLEFQQQTQK